MVRFLYRIDTPTNIFPSIHVFNSIAVAVAAADSEALKKHTWVVRGSNVLALLIVCATVFLKQHTVLDVISAVYLLCVRFIYRPGYAIGRRSVTERVEVLK
jgi:membrane-associated phospholipid phosphatase